MRSCWLRAGVCLSFSKIQTGEAAFTKNSCGDMNEYYKYVTSPQLKYMWPKIRLPLMMSL